MCSNVVEHRLLFEPSTLESIDKIQRLTDELRKLPDPIQFLTEHLFHAGMYTRTVIVPENAVFTATLIKVPTVLIVAGHADFYHNDTLKKLIGYNVVPGSAMRKVALVTYSITGMSMFFPTKATTVEEAQREFTDEHDQLVPLSEEHRHRTLITGE